jgi:ankyrin repeat protein
MQFFCFRKKSKPGVNYKTYQELLLKYLEKDKLTEFKELLKNKAKYINPDHVYDYPCFKTCLAIASDSGLTTFIKALLENGADPNVICTIHSGQAAIHFAAKERHIDAIRCLVQHSGTINVIDRQGNTALHLIASNLTGDNKKAEECFLYLASLKDTNIRHLNAQGLSAISMAVGKFSEHIWEAVLERSDLRPEDRQLILDQHPKFKKDNRENFEAIYTHDDAYTDLRNKNFESFKANFKKEFVNETDMIETTFLQLACKEGYHDIVKLLLDFEADVNKTGTHENRPPVYLACYRGQHDILVSLLDTKKVDACFVEEKSLLHGVLLGCGICKTPTDGYRKCFDCLLERKYLQIPVNHCDEYGHTALHYAAELEEGYYTKTLLENGAYIGSLNKFGFSPLHDIGPQVLEEILDNCVECTKTNKDNQYNLKFNFNMLKPTETCNTNEQIMDPESRKRHQDSLPEMSPLYFISRSNKFGHLLKHPVLRIFLHLKWTRVCVLFYINMIYYITFAIFLTADVLSETSSPADVLSETSSPIRVILLVLTAILVVRELIQFCLLPKKWRYFCNLDNILELCIIVTTILILNKTHSKPLIAVTLLLVWMEVILQLGCIYSLAVYNEMMKKVTLNYIKFLFLYLPLILAFSFSFYMLYHKEYSSEWKNGTSFVNSASGNFSVQENKTDFYHSLPTSLLKTAVMMTGEFDASDMSFNIDNGSYFVFLFFVFMMTIVLMNLLNGLAVSDTQAIRNDAELVAYRSKVQLVYYFESVVFGGSFKSRCRCHLTGRSPSLCCPWQRRLQKAISLFPDVLQEGYLSVVLNHGTRYTNLKLDKHGSDVEFRPETCCRIGKYKMGLEVDREVLMAAKDIADQRTKQSQCKENQIVNRIAKVEEDLQGCMKQLANLEKLLKQLINNQ